MKYVVIVPDGAADYPIDELNGKTPLEEGKWHHITGVLDKTEITIFVDGIEQEVISIPELVVVGNPVSPL